MTPGLTSIVIATFNHGAVVGQAITSALKQTAKVEVIVVDDGSTDDTAKVLATYQHKIRAIRQANQGPSAARNAGLAAVRGQYVMFLDADDVIAPDKVEKQIAAMSDHVGWVICDVKIEDEARGTRLASEQYRYAQRELGGWIRDQLAISNFIPVMSPLVRRSVIGDIRFEDSQTHEDWNFWYAVAAVGRVRYIPDVLATYRKRRSGRHTDGQRNLPPPPASGLIKLNLGCGTQGALSWHPMPGCVNLDRSMGWMFEDGLPQYQTSSVDAITISHALMYVHEMDWPKVFREFARVLKPGGVVRITEDSARDPQSCAYGGWKGSEPAVTLTSSELVTEHLSRVGLKVHRVDVTTTKFKDRSLMQAQHGVEPNLFFIEGVKP